MKNKTTILIILVLILGITSTYSMVKLYDAKQTITSLEDINMRQKEENKKLLDANNKTDSEIDKLINKYDKLNNELDELKKEANQ